MWYCIILHWLHKNLLIEQQFEYLKEKMNSIYCLQLIAQHKHFKEAQLHINDYCNKED